MCSLLFTIHVCSLYVLLERDCALGDFPSSQRLTLSNSTAVTKIIPQLAMKVMLAVVVLHDAKARFQIVNQVFCRSVMISCAAAVPACHINHATCKKGKKKKGIMGHIS